MHIYQRWKRDMGICGELSQSLVVVEKHRSKENGLNSKRGRAEISRVSQVLIQKWFSKSDKYWTVDPQSTT